VKHLGEGIGLKPRKKKRAKFKLFLKNVKQIKCDTLTHPGLGANENKTRTPIFLEMTKHRPPTQKNAAPRHIYNASKKILAKI
jgi:hypothetical protein